MKENSFIWCMVLIFLFIALVLKIAHRKAKNDKARTIIYWCIISCIYVSVALLFLNLMGITFDEWHNIPCYQ